MTTAKEKKRAIPFQMMERSALDPSEGKELYLYSFFWTAMLFLAVPAACAIYGGWETLFPDLWRIWFSPSKLVTDYFELGGIGATFLNAALCGLACNIAMILVRATPDAKVLAGYFLVIAHCFYGLNFINMWPSFFGIAVYCAVMKKSYRDRLYLSMFATSLGPFISDFLFRYTQGDSFDAEHPTVNLWGILLSLVFGIASGFIIPAILPGTTSMHKGFNLFKAGLAIGLFGMFAYAFFYKTFGLAGPDVIHRINDAYESQERSYLVFINIFFSVIFLSSLLFGFFRNKRSFFGYHKLFGADGW